MLHHFLTGNIGISNLLPNTHYVESRGRNPVTEIPLSGGEWRIDLKKGEKVLIHPHGAKVTPVITPLPVEPQEKNIHGVRKGSEIKQIHAWPELPLPKQP